MGNDIPCGRHCEARGYVPGCACICARDRSPEGGDGEAGSTPKAQEPGPAGTRPEALTVPQLGKFLADARTAPPAEGLPVAPTEEAWEREDVEAVADCLGDDAAQLRDDNEEDERATNMDRAASMLTWMLLTHQQYAATPPAPQPTAQPVGWLFICRKPGRVAEFASIHDSGSEHWPWDGDGWQTVDRVPLAACGERERIYTAAAPTAASPTAESRAEQPR